MSTTIKKTFAYLFIIIGTILTAFFEGYRGHSGAIVPYNFIGSVVGLVLLFAGFAMYYNSRKARVSPGQNISAINALINSGEKITVDFQNCKVVSSESVKSAPEHDDAAVLLAGRTLNAIDNAMDDGQPIGSTLYQSVFVFETEWKGKRRKFISPVIAKEPVTLEFLLAGKKNTTLYIDKLDPSKYYFDLSFLKN